MKMIWKILKWVLIVLLILVLIVVLFLWWLSRQPSAPYHYTTDVKTGTELEKKYLAMGEMKPTIIKEKAEAPSEEFTICYPENIAEESREYPVVMMLNGTGVLPEKYDTVFKHLASWGFVVIGDNNPSTGTGNSADLMFAELEKLSEDKDSPLYHKLNLNDIGLEGHSQGGAGVLTAAEYAECRSHIKTVVALSPTNVDFAHQLGWEYESQNIHIPVLMLAGTAGDFETKSVIPISTMEKMYQDLPGIKAMARRTGADHGMMLYSADGIATAWLLWQLQGNEEAGRMFTGSDPDLKNNSLYQDVNIQVETQ